jgi:alkylation response protein AidB-like acyl-CoA dehydrogenase
MNVAERGMGLGLRAVRALAETEFMDRLGLRERTERALYRATRDGFKAVNGAGRTFAAASRLGRPARLKAGPRGDLFDLVPDEEQQMIQESFRDFAAQRLRKAALDADAACATQAELLDQAEELGITMLGVPEELGGAVSERSAVTTVLAAEALAHGDMGIAVAALAPAGVAAALALWGDADQQSTYLPPFVGDDVPAAALALLEPRALFDPFALATTATPDGGDYVLNGTKSLVPRGADAELLIVAAERADGAPALFVVEPGKGMSTKAAPGMGIRASATADVHFDGFRVPASALLADGDPAVYAECVRRARIAWCALSVGTARAVLDYVIPYVNERTAFGEPISHRQAVAFTVSDIAIELEGMRLATLRAASRADAGKDFGRETALARALCADKGARIGSDGVQLLGGHGYVKEHPVERWYRDLRAVGVMEGALLV